MAETKRGGPNEGTKWMEQTTESRSVVLLAAQVVDRGRGNHKTPWDPSSVHHQTEKHFLIAPIEKNSAKVLNAPFDRLIFDC